MLKTIVTLSIRGKNFLSTLASSNLGVSFSKKNDPGEIGTSGRYAGQQTPYGSCTLQVPNTIPQEAEVQLDWLLDFLNENKNDLKKLGAEDYRIHFSQYYTDQCNFEISDKNISKLFKLGLGLSISCYHKDEK
jgi:hypothetical protein